MLKPIKTKDATLSVEGRVATLTFERDDVRNALTGTALFDVAGPLDYIEAAVFPAVVDIRFPRPVTCLFCLDFDDDTLRTENRCGFGDEFRILHCARVERDFVGARTKQAVKVLQFPDAAPHRHRYEDTFRGRAH